METHDIIYLEQQGIYVGKIRPLNCNYYTTLDWLKEGLSTSGLTCYALVIKKEEMELVKRNIAGALTNLNEKESYIIKNRVMTDNPETLQEIGNKYNITRERARQIEKQALKKLRVAIPYLGNEKALLET